MLSLALSKWLSLSFLLIAGHAVADYVLQTDRMERYKHPQQPRRAYLGPWWWWLLAHSLVNGIMVSLLTQNWWLGLLETKLHFWVDYAKMRHWVSTNEDQSIHVLSKLVWASLA